MKLTLLDDTPLYLVGDAIEWFTPDVRGSHDEHGRTVAKCAICTRSGVRFFIKEEAEAVGRLVDLVRHFEGPK